MPLIPYALASALVLAALPALAQQAPPVIVQVVPQGQQAPQAGAQQQVAQPQPAQAPAPKPPAQTVGVQGVPPQPDQAK